ncbi:MAG: nitrous oxide reductase family maturation protein NosD [Planctomycetes bacterium]|nr:nitrous oxide reductase family maturation protein NosD [Planctomycetota bacterium]
MRDRAPVIMAAALLAVVAVTSARAAPFDIAEAIASAPDGAVIDVPPGVYDGPFVLDRSVTLNGGGEAVLDGGGEGDVVRIEAEGVTIRGFVIRNTGKSLDRENAGITGIAPRIVIEDNVFEDVLFGVYLKGATDSVIRGNHIGGKDLAVARRGDGIRIWQSHRTRIEDNVLWGCRDAVMWFSDEVYLRGNHITRGRYGLHFMYSNNNVIEENHLEKNSVGAFLMYSKGLVLRRNVFARNRGPSGYGVGLKDMDGTRAEENVFVGNRIGLRFDTSPSSMRIHDVYERNVFAYNDIGIAFLPSVKRNRFRDNVFHENLEQVAVLGRGTFSGNDFTIEGRGNFWSDYRGYDLDGDGIGDVTYRSDSLFENLMDREPKLRLFLYSPAQQAIEMAARAFPAVRPRPKITDEAPLIQPVHVDSQYRDRLEPIGMLLVGSVLLAVSMLAIGAGGRSFDRGGRAGA